MIFSWENEKPLSASKISIPAFALADSPLKSVFLGKLKEPSLVGFSRAYSDQEAVTRVGRKKTTDIENLVP